MFVDSRNINIKMAAEDLAWHDINETPEDVNCLQSESEKFAGPPLRRSIDA